MFISPTSVIGFKSCDSLLSTLNVQYEYIQNVIVVMNVNGKDGEAAGRCN